MNWKTKLAVTAGLTAALILAAVIGVRLQAGENYLWLISLTWSGLIVFLWMIVQTK